MVLLTFNDFTNINETTLTINQTPNVEYHVNLNKKSININIDLPKQLNISKSEADLLEKNIQNMMEIMLSKYF